MSSLPGLGAPANRTRKEIGAIAPVLGLAIDDVDALQRHSAGVTLPAPID